MNWQEQLHEIVQSNGAAVQSFERWIDAKGYRNYLTQIASGPLEMQARAVQALYRIYLSEVEKRAS